MALVSPGVEVTITDESQYLPSATNSVPLVVIATAQNKANAANTGVATATIAANANKLYQVTSQRDLANLYGMPFFYTTTAGTPIQGYELNEYGLLAAYSLLGVTNRCYVLRADIDLASLVGQTSRPVGAPADGTWWLDTTNTAWGIYQFNQTTGSFTLQTPIVITASTDLTGGVPNASLGNIGDYAVNAIQITTDPASNAQYFYKTTNNEWVPLGSSDWMMNIPTVQGSVSNTEFTSTKSLTITLTDGSSTTVTVNNGDTVTDVAADINSLGWGNLAAEIRSGKLVLLSSQVDADGSAEATLEISGTALAPLGMTAGVYYQPNVSYGTSAQMPLWTSSQSTPRPSGSVWIKVGAAGVGLNPKVSIYSTATESWINKNVSLGTSDWQINAVLDATGGTAIPAKSVYAQYNFDNQASVLNVSSPVYLWERIATGPTVVTGTEINPEFTSGPYDLVVNVSVPGSASLSSSYTVTVSDNSSATDFVTAWSSANIPYTTAAVTSNGAIQITHTKGGAIVLDDTVDGISNGLLEIAGFVAGATSGCKFGPAVTTTFSGVASTSNHVGVNATFDVTSNMGVYSATVNATGSGYAVGDLVTVNGSLLGGGDNLVMKVTSVNTGSIDTVTYVSGMAAVAYSTQLSNWVEFEYTSNEGAPNVAPANNTNWFYSVVDQVDIMVQKGGNWYGYGMVAFDSNGHPAATGSNTTDPNGPIFSPVAPTLQSTGSALSYGDLWIGTSAENLENYPVISRWQSVGGVDQWVLINTTDQTSSNGITFADARWATSGSVSPVDDPIPSITSLLNSDYLDLDAPEPTLYPQGMLLFNTRRSGYNVKQYRTNYFTNATFGDVTLPDQTSTWVSVSGLQSNGAAYMGRKAQRNMVVNALRTAISTNTAIRDEDNFFNLIATPNYPELQPSMIELNSARSETAYIIGDTPMRLADSATAVQAWANNEAGATSTGEDGLVSRNTYMGLFYPSGITTDPSSGNLVAVPASHMMLYTFLKNDTISYPWLAAAGTRRGIIYNATNIGYVDATTGEFITIKNRIGLRDVLYTNFINPLVFFTGVGLLNYGNKSSFDSQSALDRTNVARLVAYIRRQLTIASRPFVFEPNDALTRAQIAGVIQTLMVDLVAKRGLYDYIVQCDDQNNTPARIDRNELWVNVAIEPVKSAEFIYIPVRIYNTGEIQNLAA
jgi:phage tail sheath protein FI